MLKELSPKAEQLKAKLLNFMEEHVYPNEEVYEDN